jgi:hypothetical protein
MPGSDLLELPAAHTTIVSRETASRQAERLWPYQAAKSPCATSRMLEYEFQELLKTPALPVANRMPAARLASDRVTEPSALAIRTGSSLLL